MTWLITGLYKFPGSNFKEVWLHTIKDADDARQTYNELITIGEKDKSLYGAALESWVWDDHELVHGDFNTRMHSHARQPDFLFSVRQCGIDRFPSGCPLTNVNNLRINNLMSRWMAAYGEAWTNGRSGERGAFIHWKDVSAYLATGTCAAEVGEFYFIDRLPDTTGAVRTFALKRRYCKASLEALKEADQKEQAEKKAALTEIEAAIVDLTADISHSDKKMQEIKVELARKEDNLTKLIARRDAVKVQLTESLSAMPMGEKERMY